jgi:hypothetical protein
MRVHTALGPGLLESAYRACLIHELRSRGFKVASEVGLPVIYLGEKIDLGYLSCFSYMRLSRRQVGLLINFHVEHLKDGIRRMVDGYDWQKNSTTENTEFHRGTPQRY